MNSCAALLRTVGLATLVAIAGAAAAEQAYPVKPIRIIVPFPPGSGTTTVAHLVGQKFTESWGQPVIVDNRGGGSTVIGSQAVAKSPPDGYTLMHTTSTHLITSLLLPTPYDAIKDFAPVATLLKSEFVLVLHPSVPANTLQEFISLAKSRPGQLNYASASVGSVGHLGIEIFSTLTGVKMQHVPYKGTGPAVSDLIGGQVQVLLAITVSALPHIKSGKLKAIAYSGETRLPALPQVPTFSEAGMPGFSLNLLWYGVFAPAGTPATIVDKLSAEIARIVRLPDVKEKLASQGLDPFYSTPGEFAALLRTHAAEFAKVIKAANIKAEE